VTEYVVRVSIPFRTPAGRDLEPYEEEIVLRNPPVPLASLSFNINRYGHVFRFPLNIRTISAAGKPLPDGSIITVEWPGGIELAPEHTEIATVARADGEAVQVVKEIYRG
jgi:hypothetical protein